MDSEGLNTTKSLIDSVCQMALLIPLEDARAVLDEINRTDTLMPILDPTGYRRIMKTLPGHEKQVRAFVAFRARLEKLAHPECGE